MAGVKTRGYNPGVGWQHLEHLCDSVNAIFLYIPVIVQIVVNYDPCDSFGSGHHILVIVQVVAVTSL